VQKAEQQAQGRGGGGQAARARKRAVAQLLLLNGLRRGEVSRIAMGDWDPATPLELAIRGKGRSERESIALDPLVAESLRAWLKVRPSWAPAQSWALMFTALDPGVRTSAWSAAIGRSWPMLPGASLRPAPLLAARLG